MRAAHQIVSMLLESEVVRVCAQCEKNKTLAGQPPVEVQPGQVKSHGLCRRHALEYFKEFPDLYAEYKNKPDATFSPDLGF